MKSKRLSIHACLILTLSFPLVLFSQNVSLAEKSILMQIPSIIASTCRQARFNSYETFQQCLWGEGGLCNSAYDQCIKEMNEMATRFEQECYQELATCTGQCGSNQTCIELVCIPKFNTCTEAAQKILISKQSECNAELEQCYDKAIESCIELPVSLTELYPRWYTARQ